MMNVTMLTHTQQPELICSTAARLCYSSSDIRDMITADPKAGLLEKILDSGHHSVLEHASFTFGIEGISRVTSHQLVRHRIASFSQQSQRYTSSRWDDMFIVPDSVLENESASHIAHGLLQCTRNFYDTVLKMGIPAEDARYLLPAAAPTKMIVTMNARELLHFFELRCCNRAQWEIRGVADEMLRLCKQVAPNIFKLAGPSCVAGTCNEGQMSCKNKKENR